MAFLFFHNFFQKNNVCQNRRFWDHQKCQKKVQKGPEAPKPIFSEGGGWILKVVGEFWRWWVNSEGGGQILEVVGKFWRATPSRKCFPHKHIWNTIWKLWVSSTWPHLQENVSYIKTLGKIWKCWVSSTWPLLGPYSFREGLSAKNMALFLRQHQRRIWPSGPLQL